MALPISLALALLLQAVQGKLSGRALAVITIAVLAGALRGETVVSTSVPADLHLADRASGEVIGLPRFTSGGVQVRLSVSEISFQDGGGAAASFLALVRLPAGADAAPGDRLGVVWSVTPLDRLPPGYARYVASQGASASGIAWNMTVEDRGASGFRWLTKTQERVTEGLRSVIPGDAGSLAAGIVTGNDASLSDSARQAFLRTGTTHITAVSGSNVAMVLALWTMVIRSSRARRALIVQVSIVVTIWLYAVLVGLEPSAVRAAIVASLGIFPGRFGRKADPLTILMLTLGAMALWNPNYTRMIGFWLSAVASFAIVSRMPTSGAVTFRSAVQGIAQGVVLAQAATMPLVLMAFGTWSVSSILANVLIQPTVTLAFPLTFILALLVLALPGLAPVVAWVPALLLEFVITVVNRLSPLGSPVQIEPVGISTVVGIALPCCLILIVASSDAERWARTLRSRWALSPRMAVGMVLVPAAGIVVGVIASMMG